MFSSDATGRPSVSVHAATNAAMPQAAARSRRRGRGEVIGRGEDTGPRRSGSTHGQFLTSPVPRSTLPSPMATIRDVVEALNRRAGVDAVVVVGRDGLAIDSRVKDGVDGESVAALLPP